MKDLVSVITPVYNSENTILACLECVQNQFYIDFEHILVDDFSTDESAKIIKNFASKDKRIRYIRLPENSGPGIARNKGIEMAKGRYIAFLDSDDLWLPQKLEYQIEFMRKRKVPFTFTSYKVIDDDNKETGEIRKAKSKITFKNALFYNPIGCLTAMYDTEYFGKQYMPRIRKRQDYALWLNLLKVSDGYGIEKPLALYRDTKNSLSSNKLDLLLYQWKLYREELGLNIPISFFYTCTSVINRIFRLINPR